MCSPRDATQPTKSNAHDDVCATLCVCSYLDPSSRIPTVRVGTPEEDALRRDFTVNALFYRVLTPSERTVAGEDTMGVLEDLTGSGIDDLGAQLLRTPLPPHETMRDDALRALRAVRFASRFGLRLDPQLCEAIRRKTVTRALRDVISAERVGVELAGSLRGEHAPRAAALLGALRLRDAVLAPHSEWWDEKSWEIGVRRLDALWKWRHDAGRGMPGGRRDCSDGYPPHTVALAALFSARIDRLLGRERAIFGGITREEAERAAAAGRDGVLSPAASCAWSIAEAMEVRSAALPPAHAPPLHHRTPPASSSPCPLPFSRVGCASPSFVLYRFAQAGAIEAPRH